MRAVRGTMSITSWIAGLMRTDYPALGFIPETTVERRYIAKNRYILQTDERGRRVGYLLHGAIHYGKAVVVSQAMIDYDKRLRGYGKLTVAELVRRAEIGGASSIKLRCAADLPAVRFWQSLGFEVVGVEPGGEKRNRVIVKFIRLLPLPLFVPLTTACTRIANAPVIEAAHAGDGGFYQRL